MEIQTVEKKELLDQNGESVSDFFNINGNTSVVCDGPLATAYTNALNEIYKREYDPFNGVALETQANDEIEAKRMWLASKIRSLNFINDGTDIGMIYGVKEAQTTHENVIDVVDTFAEMNDSQRANSAVIIEGTAQTPTSGEDGEKPQIGHLNPNSAALEQYALSKGIAVYRSLNQFIQRHAV